MSGEEDILVTRFREYIRVNTMQPNPDYKKAEEFIKKYGDELGLGYGWKKLFMIKRYRILAK